MAVVFDAPPAIVYPDSDGQPMSDNTKQFRWIVTIQGGLDGLFRHEANVFVAGDLLWYPVEGHPEIRRAPDAMVVFGRPKGDRGSYRQWLEDDIAPQVVFEVLSPKNTHQEMALKLAFYQRYGVEEYYIYDPDHPELVGWLRHNEVLVPVEHIEGWTSPRLGVRFVMESGELAIYRPDGARFLTYVELEQAREQERVRADEERARADEERARADRLAAQLWALGVDPDML
jgi:Uma2 family endonuclease